MRQLRLTRHPELRRREWGLDLQREGRQFTGRWQEQISGKQVFAVPGRTNRPCRAPCSFPHQPTLSIVTPGDGSLAGPGLLSEFF